MCLEQVEWAEINAAWGQTLLLLYTIARKLDYTFEKWVAARAFVALGLEGLARIDVFVTAGGEIIVNEVNTMPGFTHISMFPVLWDNTGLAYPDLITDLIEHALAKPRGLR